jgi:hypothetical protein
MAALHVLNTVGSAARLLYIYFCGDISGVGRTCPSSEADWAEPLASRDHKVGLPAHYSLGDRIHKSFIDVQCSD